jgi:hypothetical protein
VFESRHADERITIRIIHAGSPSFLIAYFFQKRPEE